MCSQYERFKANGELEDHPRWGTGWFYHRVDYVEERFGWGKKKQRKMIDLLISKGLVECQSFGRDNKRHFRFTDQNQKNLQGFFEGIKKISADTLQRSQPVRSKGANQNSLQSNEILKIPLEEVDKEERTKEEISNIIYISKKPSISPLSLKTPKPVKKTASANASLPSADASEVFAYFLGKIRERKPDFKEPNKKEWLKDIAILLEKDKRSISRAKELIDFALTDDFWYGNVLCPSKLIKQWDKLDIKEKKERQSNSPSNPNAKSPANVKEHLKIANAVYKRMKCGGEVAFIVYDNECLFQHPKLFDPRTRQKCQIFKYNEYANGESLKNALIGTFRKLGYDTPTINQLFAEAV